jgi:thioredoxin-like negative regulator of GroEL
MAMKAVQDEVMSAAQAAHDTLYCVCLLADWQPGCQRLLPQLELGNGKLRGHAVAGKHVRLVRVDASEGRWLQRRFNIRSVPMLLMFYAGQLVAATNAVSSGEELVNSCVGALERGRKGVTLPDSFAFGDSDNQLLDCIGPTMKLSGAMGAVGA